MASAIGVGIVGLSASGGWASRAHVPALAAVDGFELRALSASTPESARSAGEQHGVPLTFGSAEELAASDAVDLVVVAVKVPHHRELVLPALEAGKAVLCEWPLGNGLAEAEELAAAAAGPRTFVGLQARSAPTFMYLRDLVADGYVGEVLSTSVVASSANWGATFTTRGTYMLDRDNGATLLTVPFGHSVDVLTMVLGEFTDLTAVTATRRPEVRNAETGETATMTAEDQIAVAGVLEGGAVASLHFRGGRSRGLGFHWEINGTDGDITVTQDLAHPQFGRVALRGARGDETELAELAVPASYRRVQGLDEDEDGYNVAHAYVQILGDLTEGTGVAPDFAHGVRRHRLLEDIERAALRASPCA